MRKGRKGTDRADRKRAGKTAKRGDRAASAANIGSLSGVSQYFRKFPRGGTAGRLRASTNAQPCLAAFIPGRRFIDDGVRAGVSFSRSCRSYNGQGHRFLSTERSRESGDITRGRRAQRLTASGRGREIGGVSHRESRSEFPALAAFLATRVLSKMGRTVRGPSGSAAALSKRNLQRDASTSR